MTTSRSSPWSQDRNKDCFNLSAIPPPPHKGNGMGWFAASPLDPGKQQGCLLDQHPLKSSPRSSDAHKLSDTGCCFLYWESLAIKKKNKPGFPSGSVVKNPPANAGDMGSTPGPGGSHMPRGNWARVPQLLSPALEPGNRSCWSHKPQSPCFTTREATTRRSLHPQPEKNRCSSKRPAQSKIN